MTRPSSYKTLDEVITYLTDISDAMTYEHRIRGVNSEYILEGQRSLVRSIDYFKAAREDLKRQDEEVRKRRQIKIRENNQE